MTSGQSPSYANSRFLIVGTLIVGVALAVAILGSVRAATWWLSGALACYAAARLFLPQSGKYEGLAVRSKFLDVMFLSINAIILGLIAATVPNLI